MAASSSSGLPVGRLDDGLPDVDMDEAIEARCVCVCVLLFQWLSLERTELTPGYIG
jgi:hypothetical protein